MRQHTAGDGGGGVGDTGLVVALRTEAEALAATYARTGLDCAICRCITGFCT